MKTKVLWVLVLSATTVGATEALASNRENTTDGTPTLTSTITPAAALTPDSSSPAPSFTPTPMVAPTWAPQAVGPVSETLKPKKPSRWISSAALGVGLPLSPNIQTAYTSGFDADLGSGYRVTDNFSIWLDLNLDLFGSKNDTLTNGNNFTLIEAAFWARYRIFNGDFSPYFFVGPGIAYNEYRSNQGAIIDVNTGYGYIPYSYEFDFLTEGGFGLEMSLGSGLATFLQGRVTYDFISPSFAAYGSTDSPLVVMPLELGIVFGL